MNVYRVKFYNVARRVNSDKLDTRTVWVEAVNESMAILTATQLALSNEGNEDAIDIGHWINLGQVYNVHAVIETN